MISPLRLQGRPLDESRGAASEAGDMAASPRSTLSAQRSLLGSSTFPKENFTGRKQPNEELAFVAPIGRHCLITPLVASVTVLDAVMSVHIHNLGPNQANTASSSPGFLVCVALHILMHFERFRSLGSRRQLVSGKRPTGYARKQVSTAKHRLLGFRTANCLGPSSSKSTHSGGKTVSNQPRVNNIPLVGRGDKLSGCGNLHLHAKPCYGFENPDQRCPSEAPKYAQTNSDLAARHASPAIPTRGFHTHKYFLKDGALCSWSVPAHQRLEKRGKPPIFSDGGPLYTATCGRHLPRLPRIKDGTTGPRRDEVLQLSWIASLRDFAVQ
ncbi:hypothetical protein CNYM01_08626 [Colletotrichum nymphaeae SA-01]|uniref:Uncharacterized protein n=1 Tax=Colletotrichum nymphaeae SA-01 TaxID=1460502 RepID=A0A135S187_9PEZI|nr:hypothetical protein CNYM01_08626 [Colletotrichum nymphaeae SA-01]